jgi:hypothetical protein
VEHPDLNAGQLTPMTAAYSREGCSTGLPYVWGVSEEEADCDDSEVMLPAHSL